MTKDRRLAQMMRVASSGPLVCFLLLLHVFLLTESVVYHLSLAPLAMTSTTPNTANAGQHQPMTTNKGQRRPRPMTANKGQRRPTQAHDSQRRLTRAHDIHTHHPLDLFRRPPQKRVYEQSYTRFLCFFIFIFIFIPPETRLRAIVDVFLMFLISYFL